MSVSLTVCVAPLDHQLQLVQVLVELGDLHLVVQQFDPQPQPGDGGLEVVGDGAEEALPIVDEAANALLHDVEGAGRRHDFGGTSSLRDGWSMSLAEADRRLGEATQGQVCQRTSMKVKKQRRPSSGR